MGTSFVARIQKHASTDPDRPTVTCGDLSLTRAEFVTQAGRLAARMAELGVGQGDTVTIGLPNSVEATLAMFATWWLGAIPQPVSHRLPAVERQAIIELAAPALVVGVAAEEAAGSQVMTAAELTVATASDELTPPPDAVAPAWKTVTSGGSTGRPKLIVATQPAEVENVSGFGSLLRFPTDGVVLVTGPLSHNAPFVVATVGLLFGDHVVVMERFDALETLRLVEKHGVQWLYLVPTMMSRIWRLPEAVRTARRHVVGAGCVPHGGAVPGVAQARRGSSGWDLRPCSSCMGEPSCRR